MRIGEFSKRSQVSIKTLRFYEAAGLFTPAHVDPDTGYRYYSADQVTALGRILHLKALGFSLGQVRAAIAGDSERVRSMLFERRREILRRIREERIRLAAVDGWLQRSGHEDTAGTHVVALKRVAVQPIASIRAPVAGYADATELFDELRQYVRKRGALAGPAAAIWHTCGDAGGPIDCEAYVHLRRPVAGNRRIAVYDLYPALLASVVHDGDSTASCGAYAAARSWITARRYDFAGPKREIYWRGGVDRDRPSDITEIQYPISLPVAAGTEPEA
jgi:DNA-binding transcriptional MerR regulator